MNVYINTKVSTVTSILIDGIKIALQRYWYEYNIRKHVTIEHIKLVTKPLIYGIKMAQSKAKNMRKHFTIDYIKLQLKCNMCNTRVSTSLLID